MCCHRRNDDQGQDAVAVIWIKRSLRDLWGHALFALPVVPTDAGEEEVYCQMCGHSRSIESCRSSPPKLAPGAAPPELLPSPPSPLSFGRSSGCSGWQTRCRCHKVSPQSASELYLPSLQRSCCRTGPSRLPSCRHGRSEAACPARSAERSAPAAAQRFHRQAMAIESA